MDEEMDNIPQEVEKSEDEEVMSKAEEGRFDRLLGENSRKFKLTGMFKDWFLDYSSYVILQRAVPDIVDGLKPVQRRILQAMYVNDTGARQKAAKIVGFGMGYHPHGDQSITGALVVLGQKGLLIDTQGNWGNIVTGDPNAAARYIECRLSQFAKEIVFNKKTTVYTKTYDGQLDEPVQLPVKFPLLLAQGAEGIAVGLASKILPHNFNELIDASIAILEDKPFEIYPDFPTGGSVDCSKYNCGRRGSVVKVRAKIDKIDKNTIAIREVPFGKTTSMLCDSIVKARDKGKIKIKKIDDFTSLEANIVIHLPSDVSPDVTIDALYAFTDCETSISPCACVIVDNKPEFLGVDDILKYSTFHTRDLLEWEQKIRLSELEDQWHFGSLEKIFFENRVYLILQNDSASWQAQLDEILARMQEFRHLVKRDITMEDVKKLVEKPVRKISKFDVKAMDEALKGMEQEMEKVKWNIGNITRFTIDYFKAIKKKYGGPWKRRTEISAFETISATKVVNNNARLCANYQGGFVGIDLKKSDNGEFVCDCSDMSEIIVIANDGRYKVSKVTDKAFFWTDLAYVSVFDRNDERTIYNAIYRDGKAGVYYAKRFAITSVTRDKEYDITQGTPGSRLVWLSANHNGEAEVVRVKLRARPKLKKLVEEWDFSALAIKSRSARGNLVTKNPVQSVTLKSAGVSTIGGKDIWFDPDIQKLNEDSRGQYLGQFSSGDHVLAVFKDGTYYTTSFDLSSRYQGELLRIEKFELGKTFTALYWDGTVKAFYIKRFSFDINDNTPVAFISEGKGSKLIALSDDKYPQVEITFAGKYEHRSPELVDAEAFIAKKGVGAKGKKLSAMDLKAAKFVEPLVKEEPVNEAADETADDAAAAAEDVVVSLEDAPLMAPEFIPLSFKNGDNERGDDENPESEGNPEDGTLF